jgi:hypothetical protein
MSTVRVGALFLVIRAPKPREGLPRNRSAVAHMKWKIRLSALPIAPAVKYGCRSSTDRYSFVIIHEVFNVVCRQFHQDMTVTYEKPESAKADALKALDENQKKILRQFFDELFQAQR